MTIRSQTSSCRSAPLGVALSLVAAACFGTDAFAQSQVVAWGRSDNGQATAASRTLLGCRMAAAGLDHTLVLRTDGSVAAWGLNTSGQTTVPSNLGTVVRIAAGGKHSMALTAQGVVKCWGDNTSGQCTVPANATGVAEIAAGYEHSVAVLLTGGVRAWGTQIYGQTTVPSNASLVKQASCGFDHTIALRQDGTICLWGDNSSGQCTAPAGLGTVTQVAAGGWFSAAIRSSGSLVAWGDNSTGACNVPPNLGTLQRIAGGAGWIVAIRADGSVVCWGDNALGQCTTPAGMSGITQVSGGGNHSVAVAADGSLFMWGDNIWGQSVLPRTVKDARSLGAGSAHALAVDADGSVSCWGQNNRGQASVPAGLSGVVEVSAGFEHSMARKSNGTVVCWGSNDAGQCTVPGTLGPATAIDAGGSFSMALNTLGQVKCWGSNSHGQCTVPGSLSGVTGISAGNVHCMALRGAGTVTCWGGGLTTSSGSLNQGQSVVPAGLSSVVQVAAGQLHSLALRSSGTVVAWGYNFNGQCTVPTGLTGVMQVDAGWGHSAALKSDGTVVVWGDNTYGQRTAPSGLAGVNRIRCGDDFVLCTLTAELSTCASTAGGGSATLRVSGGSWQDIGVWSWTNSGPRVPTVQSPVDLGPYGSVGSECEAGAMIFTSRTGSSLLVPASASAVGNDYSVRVGSTANLAGRLWLLGVSGGASSLPETLNIPVLSAGTVNGTFDLIQSDVPPPAGFFLTLVPSTVNGRTLLSLRLLPLPGNAELAGATASTFSGTAVAAATIDINHDGFDDLALAIDFGAGQNGLIQILLNDGAGNLGGTSVLKSIPAQPTCIAVGDVDNDGKRDVVVGIASDSSARVYLDNGASALVAGTVISGLGGTPTAVIVLDGAGASAMPSSNPIGVATSAGKLRIYGDSTLQQEITVAGTPSTVRGGDTKGTGGTTIVTGGTTSATFNLLPGAETGFVQTLVRGANGLYAVQQTFGLTAKPVALDVADIDGDGLADIVTANADPVLPAAGSALPVLSIFRNTNGSFSGGVPCQPSGASSGLSVVLVDVDGDGDRDIVSVHRKIGADSEAALLRVDTLGAGTPISIGQTTVLDATDPILAARGNLDGAGGDDLYLIDNGGGSFLAGTKSVKPYVAVGGARQGDLDGDGHVGTSDVALLLLDFGPCQGCLSDLDGTGVVDTGDLAFLLLLFD